MTTIPPSTSGWSAENILSKMRAVTGTPSTDQLSDQQMLAYANNYLVYTMPHELKVQISNQFLTFKTAVGQSDYSFPGTFLTDSPGAYADGFPLIFYEDPDIFYQDWPQQYNVDSVATGNGATLTFTGNTQGFPIIIGTFFITDGTQILQDDGDGDLVPVSPSTGSGSINYTTGAFSATFGTAPVSSAVIYSKYIAYQGNRPQGVLFFNNEFTFMPVPDQVYQIQMQGFAFPASLTLGASPASTPLQPEWGPLIAYGGAIEIFSDRGDTENIDRYAPMLKRYENVALSRSIQQYTPMQGVPRF